MKPIRSGFMLKRAVLHPILAAADAASQPACPPPITTTSNFMAFRGYHAQIARVNEPLTRSAENDAPTLEMERAKGFEPSTSSLGSSRSSLLSYTRTGLTNKSDRLPHRHRLKTQGRA